LQDARGARCVVGRLRGRVLAKITSPRSKAWAWEHHDTRQRSEEPGKPYPGVEEMYEIWRASRAALPFRAEMQLCTPDPVSCIVAPPPGERARSRDIAAFGAAEGGGMT